MNKYIMSLILIISCSVWAYSQDKNWKQSKNKPANRVNVFLGSSGDHGQMSPSASYPFSMLSIGPHTKIFNHTGYEYLAREYLGFVHTHMEGVGCTGSGGNILIRPYLGDNTDTPLMRKQEQASPGSYQISFENGIQAAMTVGQNFGLHHYAFPAGKHGLLVDLSYAFVGRFVEEAHEVGDNSLWGWVDTRTTCSAGIYRIYYYLSFSNAVTIQNSGPHALLVSGDATSTMEVRIGFSSVSTAYARARISNDSFEQVKNAGKQAWNKVLSVLEVEGETDREDLFYSLLYRGLQSPFLISEPDGTYRAIDGSEQHSAHAIYHGWAIWDNYREQLPLLSLAYPDRYADIARSIGNLYPYGKGNWATMHEPAPTVRTEHALVVLLDATRKGYEVPLKEIEPYLIKETEKLDYGAPDKALESSYDCWAMSQIARINGNDSAYFKYARKALDYKRIWNKDFADLTQKDVDQMQARGLYQGTIWQYRWFVPFDISGLKELTGGEKSFTGQLDRFFGDYNYNHANQPDLQVPGLYNATSQPWKSQKLFRELMLDTVVQMYFNDNSKGIDPYIGRIYQNQPQAYLRTMDDDAGTMSSWFVLRSMGLSQANVGDPVYYLTTPIFRRVTIKFPDGKQFQIILTHYNKNHCYIRSAILNGKPLDKNWLTQEEIRKGGTLMIETSATPVVTWGTSNQWISTFQLSDPQR